MLTNVTPNQHHPMLHAEQHGIYGADNVHGYMDLGSFPDSGRLHTDLYGVTPDQHHPQAHAADHAPAGADDVHGYLDLASFPVANREHADLSGIGAEDHQSQFGATIRGDEHRLHHPGCGYLWRVHPPDRSCKGHSGDIRNRRDRPAMGSLTGLGFRDHLRIVLQCRSIHANPLTTMSSTRD